MKCAVYVRVATKEQLCTEQEQVQLIKEEMESREVETLDLGNVIIRFTSILSARFDTKAFKKDFADIYSMFCKQVPSKRFSIA